MRQPEPPHLAAVAPFLDERGRRLVAASEPLAVGRGLAERRGGENHLGGRVRRAGGACKSSLGPPRPYPALISDEALFDPLEKRRQFDWLWQAVRYRYRSCAECQDEFRPLLAPAK